MWRVITKKEAVDTEGNPITSTLTIVVEVVVVTVGLFQTTDVIEEKEGDLPTHQLEIITHLLITMKVVVKKKAMVVGHKLVVQAQVIEEIETEMIDSEVIESILEVEVGEELDGLRLEMGIQQREGRPDINLEIIMLPAGEKGV